jgi:hypothetical protein
MKKPAKAGSGKKAAQKKERKAQKRSELAAVVARLAQSAEKLAQAAERLAEVTGLRSRSKQAKASETPDFTMATDAGSEQK